MIPSNPPFLSSTLPRAGFWRRVGATGIDLVTVAMPCAILPLCPIFPVVFLCYCALLWKFRGTTIGGVICHTRIVRLDDGAIGWDTALVRALGSLLSFVPFCLGFLWAAGAGKRTWHDLIAGTAVVVDGSQRSLV